MQQEESFLDEPWAVFLGMVFREPPPKCYMELKKNKTCKNSYFKVTMVCLNFEPKIVLSLLFGL